MNIRQQFLLLAAIGLIPIALSYGLAPGYSMEYLFDISVKEINSLHIFRAVMGLYLGMVVFWLAGVVKVELRQAAIYTLVVFMLGLAIGRISSLLLDGTPHWLLLFYLALELGFGLIGLVLLGKDD